MQVVSFSSTIITKNKRIMTAQAHQEAEAVPKVATDPTAMTVNVVCHLQKNTRFPGSNGRARLFNNLRKN